MCGIAGYFSESSPSDSFQKVLRALNIIRHRGPDDLHLEQTNNFCGGSVRLAIEALATGKQPIQDNRYIVGFNGEIFNYKSLTAQYGLDTKLVNSEVSFLLHGWRNKGAKLLNDLDGQFAIYVYDKLQKELFLSRDPYGIRPIFFYHKGSEIAFCSEIKGIFALFKRIFEISERSIAQIAMFWTCIGTNSIFEMVKQVPPGHYIRWKRGKIKQHRYWQDPILSNEPDHIMTESQALDLLRDTLEGSVRNQVHGSVGHASYLSGGIDSSALGHFLSKNNPNERLDTFSIAFESKEYDESDAQRKLSNFLATNHRTLKIENKDIANNFPRVIWHAETLLFRTAPVPLYLLSKEVRNAGHKVVFTGEGADEILLGYDIFFERRIREFWARQPKSNSRPALLQRLYHYLPQFKESRYFSILKDFYKSNLTNIDNVFYSHLIRWAQYQQVSSHFNFSSSVTEDSLLEELLNYLPKAFCMLSGDRKTQIIEYETLLTGYLLSSQGDRMSMAHSVEGRYPFLSQTFVTNIAKLHSLQKARLIGSKSLFRKSMRGLLTEDIVERPKVAYQAPEAKSFLSENHSSQAAEFLDEELDSLTHINASRIRSLEKKIKHPFSSSRLGFRENMSYVMTLSYAYLNKYSKEWSS